MLTCPYCGIAFSIDGVGAQHCFPRFDHFMPIGYTSEGTPDDKEFSISSHRCPNCRRQIMWLNEIERTPDGADRDVIATTLLYPSRREPPVPAGVPAAIASDYREAYLTLDISPKASAALGRRCLQNLIREREGIAAKTLYGEVSQLLALNKLPRYLADDLDSIRNVGNFAAHPEKDSNTGEIVEVEPGEAEWTLEVLHELLTFYFERQPRSDARREALNEKLRAAGKRPMLGG